MPKCCRLSLTVLAAAAVLWGPRAGPAVAEEIPSVTAGNCRELNVFIHRVPKEAVQPAFVPAEYQLVQPQAALGFAEVFIDALECDSLTVGKTSRPTLYATLAVTIEPPAADTAGSPNFYLVSWVTDNQELSGWLKESTGLGERIRLVKDLSLRWSSIAGFAPAFSFSAPFPSPTPFEISAVVRDPVVPLDANAYYWRQTSEGAVRLQANAGDDNRFGLLAGEVTTSAGSETARIFGGATTRDFEGLASDFSSAEWRKEIFP